MNRLERIDEFKALLANYSISDETKKILNQTPFVTLASVSSAGRNTMIQRLVEAGKYHFVVSNTTRKPRVNDGILEQNGREYWFTSEEEMLDGLKRGEYIEAAIIHNQQVSGVSINELKEAGQQHQIAISDIDVQGVDKMHSLSGSIIPIFVIPPSYTEWRSRLQNRGKMSEQELQNRLSSAKDELTFALSKDYFHFLINDDLEHAIKGLDKIAHGEIDPEHEAEGRLAAQNILDELRSGTHGS